MMTGMQCRCLNVAVVDGDKNAVAERVTTAGEMVSYRLTGAEQVSCSGESVVVRRWTSVLAMRR